MDISQYLIKWGLISIIWTGWCVLHSTLNSEGIIHRIGLLDSTIGPYYRLIYSVVALLTLLLAHWITPKWQEFDLWRFRGAVRIFQLILWLLAILMFYLSFRFINLWHFLGLTALGVGRKGTDTQNRLITSGIYGLIRNPQFAAGLILLWARNLTDTGMVINVVLSLYLMVGTKTEEARLLAGFGEEYRQYMSEVPRFFPNRKPSLQALFQGSINPKPKA